MDAPRHLHNASGTIFHTSLISESKDGETMSAAFEQAAAAMTAIVTDSPVASNIEIQVACEATDRELLLVEWLNAIIYKMTTRNMLFGRFQVRIDKNRIR